MSRDCESFPLFSTESIREIEVFIIVRYPCEIPDRIVEDSRVKYKCRNVSCDYLAASLGGRVSSNSKVGALPPINYKRGLCIHTHTHTYIHNSDLVALDVMFYISIEKRFIHGNISEIVESFEIFEIFFKIVLMFYFYFF